MIDIHTLAATCPTRLLDDYDVGESFFFASPERTLLARGTCARVACHGDVAELPEQVAELLNSLRVSDDDLPLVVGALPFDSTMPAQLVVPLAVTQAEALHSATITRSQGFMPPCAIDPVPEPAEYLRYVARAVTHLQRGDLAKVVLARSLYLTSPERIEVPQVLGNLVQLNRQGYTFATDLPPRDNVSMLDGATARPRTLIGASPELLISRSGMQIVSNPLAGSAPRSDDPAEDRRRAEALLSSAKDLHEHAVVVDAVAAALRPFCRRLDVPATPSLIHTATMWHLSTRITGELADPTTSSLTLALALHPTPAVCGFPTDHARALIQSLEPFDRGFYTGVVGWCDAGGDGEWVVALRCAEVADRTLRLFAGAGIVGESQPEAELAETSAKFRTMLNALGLNQQARTV